jgi:SAM-dependent methyltransferase
MSLSGHCFITAGLQSMSENQPSDPIKATLDYYESHAEEFAQRTQNIDMSPLYAKFLPLLPAGGRILDAGCGTGRDSAAFLERGYQVTAFDASNAMVNMATARIGRPVLHLSFQQMQFEREFDGVWACASLLHVPAADMLRVFVALQRALVSGGVLCASFKIGLGEVFREGRLFHDYDEETLAAFVGSQDGWAVIELWRTEDVGQQRPNVQWVNALLRKVSILGTCVL